ncbi:MAG: membrane protein insertase YidC [Acidobacteria bacterium]|nr:membrane protein insertase YidC [Acidobacteriota bacterium]
MSDFQPIPNPQKGKEMPMEIRLVIAMVLMLAVLFVTPYFYKPTPEAPPKKQEAAKAQPAPAAPAPAANAPAVPAAPAGATAAVKEEVSVIESDLFKIEVTNRGALVKSWVLKKYKDSNGKPLDLVSVAGVKKNGYPFSMMIKGREGWAPVNDALFVATAVDGGYEFAYSDGRMSAKKSIRLKKGSYILQVASELFEGSVAVPHLLAWRGGFGDASVINAAAAKHSLSFDVAENKLVTNDAKHAEGGPKSKAGNFAFAGLEDAYFAMVVLPASGSNLELLTINDMIPDKDGKDEAIVGGAIGGAGRNQLSMFVGPKDYDLLKSIDPKLEGLIDFGWTSIMAKYLFLALHYVNDNWVKSWGWSIILVTIVINILLLPLKISSLQSMRKMALVQPEMNAINDRYKGLSMKDPKMANKNEEIMALYKKHGVNPAGGCLPLVLQFPFLFAFYAVLGVSIELRQASWLWVADLSQPETLAIRVLPLVMIGTQFWLQRMTPATGGDPAQQKMMMFMPLVFGFMFYGATSGLVLYWLTGNLVGIVQQLAFNKLMPAPAAAVVAKAPAPKKKSK